MTTALTRARLPWVDRALLWIAPSVALRRIQARTAAGLASRHYEAASTSRRTAGWSRQHGDQNSIQSVAARALRIHARDLVRNNGYAKRAQRVIANNTVRWGIVPRALGEDRERAAAAWKAWATSTECDARERLDFSGVQHAVMRALVTDGEVLIRRRLRRTIDGYALPLQLQILEAEHLDASKDGEVGIEGGPIIQGVELDAIGRRVAYWLYDEHPNSALATGAPSRRIPAADVIHVFESERPNAERGVSWLAQAIVPLKDLDDLDDAELVKQKIAACFAAFVTDTDGAGPPLGTESADGSVDSLEPGMIQNLAPGKSVTFATPPVSPEGTLAIRTLRRVAVGLGITYEDLTGDYSQVNFSSARMGRLAHQANVHTWQWLLLVPQLCQGVWRWAMEAAQLAGKIRPGSLPTAEWTAPPLPMIEPDKEGLAYQRLIRGGTMTPSEMVREQGGDPTTHWVAYAADLQELDRLGIKLDSDVRAVSQAGLTQERVGLAAAKADPSPAGP